MTGSMHFAGRFSVGVLVAALAMPSAFAEVRITGANQQSAQIRDSATNTATGRSTAKQNIASNSGSVVIRGNNTQTVFVQGSVSNTATGDSKAEQNIASVSGSGDQGRKGDARAKQRPGGPSARPSADPSCWMASAQAQGRCAPPVYASNNKAREADERGESDAKAKGGSGEPRSLDMGSNGMGSTVGMMPAAAQRSYLSGQQETVEQWQRECQAEGTCDNLWLIAETALSIGGAIPSCGASVTGIGAAACFMAIDSVRTNLTTLVTGEDTNTLLNQGVNLSLKEAGVEDHQYWADLVEFGAGFIGPGGAAGLAEDGAESAGGITDAVLDAHDAIGKLKDGYELVKPDPVESK